MSWFMDPVPDGGTVHGVGTALRSAQAPYNTQIQTVQTTHDQTVVVWQGNDSDAHSRTTATTQQIAQQHSQTVGATADILNSLGTILQLIATLQMAWMAIQVATAIWGIFTAGLDALVTEGPAAALAVAIQGLKDLVVTLLQGFVKALLSPTTKIGAALGALEGLSVGMNTVQRQHLTGFAAMLTILGDMGDDAEEGGSIGMMFTGLGDPNPDMPALTDEPPIDPPSDGTPSPTGDDPGNQWSQQKYNRRLLGSTPSQSAISQVQANYDSCVWCDGPVETGDHYPALKTRWYNGDFDGMTPEQMRAAADDPNQMLGSCRSCNFSRGAKDVGTGPGQWDPRTSPPNRAKGGPDGIPWNPRWDDPFNWTPPDSGS